MFVCMRVESISHSSKEDYTNRKELTGKDRRIHPTKAYAKGIELRRLIRAFFTDQYMRHEKMYLLTCTPNEDLKYAFSNK